MDPAIYVVTGAAGAVAHLASRTACLVVARTIRWRSAADVATSPCLAGCGTGCWSRCSVNRSKRGWEYPWPSLVVHDGGAHISSGRGMSAGFTRPATPFSVFPRLHIGFVLATGPALLRPAVVRASCEFTPATACHLRERPRWSQTLVNTILASLSLLVLKLRTEVFPVLTWGEKVYVRP